MSYQISTSNNGDNLHTKLEHIISNSLPNNYIGKLRNNPESVFKWDPYDVDILLTMYCQLIEYTTISYIITSGLTLNEPILLVMLNQKLVNVVNIDFIKNLFVSMFSDYDIDIREVRDNTVSCSFPKILNVTQSSVNITNHITIPEQISTKLIFLYTLADHAAYHFKCFKTFKDTDYQHDKVSRLQGAYLHELLTRNPDHNIEKFVSVKNRDKKKIIKNSNINSESCQYEESHN